MSAKRTPRQILVAPAWPYASGPRHIGHVAGFAVPADILARYHRLRGDHVLMASGTDEHGTPVMVAADDEGVSPREIADRYNQLIREDLRELGIAYDIFTRTTTQNHYRVTRDLFRTLYERGYVFERETEGAFSATTGHTLPDRYIEGTCPHCGFESARGDQCDNCGRQLDPVDLIEPRSRIDGQPPVFRKTKHLFLDLPQFAERLASWIDSHTEWRREVRNFSRSFVDELKPRAITRDLDWGVPIPVPGYDGLPDKKIYVWFDAVIGYLSASVEWSANVGRPDAWRDWWQNPEARHYYVQGRDNIIFHTVMWPSMLLGYGPGGELGCGRGELHLPDEVVASGHLQMEGRRFSTSRRVGIYVRDFLSRYEPDPLRYYLVAAGPETQDSDFTWAEFVRRNNDELVANWGNLVNRTLTVAHRNFGQVPEAGPLTPEDERVVETVGAAFPAVGDLIAASRFRAALGEAMAVAAQVNQYASDQAPWALVKTDEERAATVVNVALRAIDSLKILLTPFLPFSSQTVHELLGYEGRLAGPLEFREVTEANGESHLYLSGDYASWEGSWEPSSLEAGRPLPAPRPLYPKLDPELVEEELRRMDQAE
jgi:methionyl-tRNA synthetase